MADIAITDITTGAVDGSGVFDKLMQAGEAHLSNEYKDNRITGKEYSTVYLGMMQASMQNALQFVLGEQQADKQADLVTEQILTQIEQTQVAKDQSALLAQKKITEIAQTVDATGGTMKKQQDLITAQTDGFLRDAEQKMAKIFSDVYNINRSALGSSATIPTALDDIDISTVMAKAAAGIGVTIS